jgi:mRNA interferase RelE/StbE
LTRYKLRFHELALNEWQQLDGSIREPLKKKLAERLESPRVPAAALHGMANCYKIKLHSVGYRLIYRVDDAAVFVTVIATGKRKKTRPTRRR